MDRKGNLPHPSKDTGSREPPKYLDQEMSVFKQTWLEVKATLTLQRCCTLEDRFRVVDGDRHPLPFLDRLQMTYQVLSVLVAAPLAAIE